MEALSSVISIAGQILEHYEKIKKARAELRALVELVRTVKPLLEDFLAEMRSGGRVLSRSDSRWIDTLKSALEGADEVVVKVVRNPIKVAMVPSWYSAKILDANSAIKEAMDFIKMTTGTLAAKAAHMSEQLVDDFALLESSVRSVGEQLEGLPEMIAQAMKENNQSLLEQLSQQHGDGTAEDLKRQVADLKTEHEHELKHVKDSAYRAELEAALALSRVARTAMVPDELKCPITLELMEEPVMLVQSGQTYDREAILTWLIKNPNKCPLTGDFEGEAKVQPNYAVKGLVDKWVEVEQAREAERAELERVRVAEHAAAEEKDAQIYQLQRQQSQLRRQLAAQEADPRAAEEPPPPPPPPVPSSPTVPREGMSEAAQAIQTEIDAEKSKGKKADIKRLKELKSNLKLRIENDRAERQVQEALKAQKAKLEAEYEAAMEADEYDRCEELQAKLERLAVQQREEAPAITSVAASPSVSTANPTKMDQKLIEWAKKNPNATKVPDKYQGSTLWERSITDVGFVALASSCPKLTVIYTNNTKITDLGVQALANSCPNLKEIYLFRTKVTDVGVQALANSCRNLTRIVLNGTQVTDVGAQALANSCPKLTKIWLNSTQVTDVGAQALANSCPNLTKIVLDNTQVTDAAKQQMKAKLPNLKFYM
eukprot:CAMPEP_0119543064 /NCGR_PEP_ID=MMETSP1344-20130328/53924_1 /TAXON_ID=236787 /ORGANISM="Florenciella parvula, Strain CCMP2471" /LENGTH=656 /DNA_ID=CAMNT_0007587337 /DNA_START=35 /DNA_END=2005 /DNA_ORIENTATION=-